MELKFKNTDRDSWFECLKDGPPIRNCKEKRIVKQISD